MPSYATRTTPAMIITKPTIWEGRAFLAQPEPGHNGGEQGQGAVQKNAAVGGRGQGEAEVGQEAVGHPGADADNQGPLQGKPPPGPELDYEGQSHQRPHPEPQPGHVKDGKGVGNPKPADHDPARPEADHGQGRGRPDESASLQIKTHAPISFRPGCGWVKLITLADKATPARGLFGLARRGPGRPGIPPRDQARVDPAGNDAIGFKLTDQGSIKGLDRPMETRH